MQGLDLVCKLFVEEGAHVFLTGRRQEALDEAVTLIGRNVTGVQGDSADLHDLDRLFDTVKREKGAIDVLWASAGMGEAALQVVEQSLRDTLTGFLKALFDGFTQERREQTDGRDHCQAEAPAETPAAVRRFGPIGSRHC